MDINLSPMKKQDYPAHSSIHPFIIPLYQYTQREQRVTQIFYFSTNEITKRDSNFISKVKPVFLGNHTLDIFYVQVREKCLSYGGSSTLTFLLNCLCNTHSQCNNGVKLHHLCAGSKPAAFLSAVSGQRVIQFYFQ